MIPSGCVPAGQPKKKLVHCDADVAPVLDVIVPFGQGVHLADPADAEKEPTSQGAHTTNGDTEKKPALHAVQLASPGDDAT